MKRSERPCNKYKLLQETTLTTDCHYYSLGESVRKAFEGLTDNLYDHVVVEPKRPINAIEVRIEGNSFISLKAGHSFDFLSSARFLYRKSDQEPWELSVNDMDDGFGMSMSVSAATPRACVKAMIQERKNYLKKMLKDLNKFRTFDDYTRLNHYFC